MPSSTLSVILLAAAAGIYALFTGKSNHDDEEQQSPPQPSPSPRSQTPFTSSDHGRHYSSRTATTHTINSHLTPSASTHAQPSYQQPRIEPRAAQATANTKENLEFSHHVHRHRLASSTRTVPTSAAKAQIPHPTQSTASRVHQTTSTTSGHLDPLHRTSLTSPDARDSLLTPSTYTSYTAQRTSARAQTTTRTDYDNSLHRSAFDSSSIWGSYQTTPTRTRTSYSTQRTSTGVAGTTVRTPIMPDYDDMGPSPYSYLRTPSPDASRARVSGQTVSPKKHSRTHSSSSDSDYLGPSSRTRAVPRFQSLEVHDAIADVKDKKRAMELRDQAKRSVRDMLDARDRARIAHKAGDHEAGDEHGQDARAHESAKNYSDKRAAEILFRVNNKAHEEGTVDLHDLYVAEAVEYAKDELQSAMYRNDDTVNFIVGQGRHSEDGVPKLRPALERLFDERRLRYSLDPGNAGKLIVYLD